jgi:hypothetical protein
VEFNPWNLRGFRIFPRVEFHEPQPNGRAKRFERKPPMFLREEIKLEETCMKKISRTQGVRPRIMVKRRGNLNQAL